jgi:hypothetical protein
MPVYVLRAQGSAREIAEMAAKVIINAAIGRQVYPGGGVYQREHEGATYTCTVALSNWFSQLAQLPISECIEECRFDTTVTAAKSGMDFTEVRCTRLRLRNYVNKFRCNTSALDFQLNREPVAPLSNPILIIDTTGVFGPEGWRNKIVLEELPAVASYVTFNTQHINTWFRGGNSVKRRLNLYYSIMGIDTDDAETTTVIAGRADWPATPGCEHEPAGIYGIVPARIDCTVAEMDAKRYCARCLCGLKPTPAMICLVDTRAPFPDTPLTTEVTGVTPYSETTGMECGSYIVISNSNKSDRATWEQLVATPAPWRIIHLI